MGQFNMVTGRYEETPDENIRFVKPWSPSQSALLYDSVKGTPGAQAAVSQEVGNISPDNPLLQPASAPQATPENIDLPQAPMTNGSADRSILKLVEQYGPAAQKALGQQEAGINQIQDQINQVAREPQATNWKPLASFYGLGDAVNTPETPETKREKILALQEKLQSARGSLSTANLANLKDMIQSQVTSRNQERQDQKLQQLITNATNRTDQGADRLSQKVSNDVLNDKQLANATQRIQGAQRIEEQFAAVKSGKIKDTSQFLNDVNAELSQLLIGASNGALGKLERTEYASLPAKGAALMQKLTAEPQSINSPAILKQIEDTIHGLKAVYQKNIDTRADMLKRNYRTKDAQRAVDDAVAGIKNNYGSQSEAQQPQGGLQIGHEEGGHVYLGGDPGNPKSWKEK